MFEDTENHAVMGYYAAISGNFLPMFRDNLSVSPSGLKLRVGPMGRPETLVINYHYYLRNNPEERGYQILRGGSMKSYIRRSCFMTNGILMSSRFLMFSRVHIRTQPDICFEQ